MGRFVKGQSGNPAGRPKGFGSLIRDLTKDGDELVRLALKVMRGEITIAQYVGKEAMEVQMPPSFKERLEALKWLADRGWGAALPEAPRASQLTSQEMIEELRNRAGMDAGGAPQGALDAGGAKTH